MRPSWSSTQRPLRSMNRWDSAHLQPSHQHVVHSLVGTTSNLNCAFCGGLGRNPRDGQYTPEIQRQGSLLQGGALPLLCRHAECKSKARNTWTCVQKVSHGPPSSYPSSYPSSCPPACCAEVWRDVSSFFRRAGIQAAEGMLRGYFRVKIHKPAKPNIK